MTPDPLPFAIATAIIVFSFAASVIYYRRDEHRREIETRESIIKFLQNGIKSIRFGLNSVVVFYNIDEDDKPVYQQFHPPAPQMQIALAAQKQLKVTDKSGERMIDVDTPQGLARVLIAASIADHGWGARTIMTIRMADDKDILKPEQWRKATDWLQQEHGIEKDNTNTRCGQIPGKSCVGELGLAIGLELSRDPDNPVFTHQTPPTHTTQQHQRGE